MRRFFYGAMSAAAATLLAVAGHAQATHEAEAHGTTASAPG